MMKNIKYIALLLFVCMALAVTMDCFAKQGEDVEINFYGKLVDDYGDSIPNASIHVHIHGAAGQQGVKKIVVKTDVAGAFTLTETGKSIKIMSIKKAGYKFDLSEKPQLKYTYVQKGSKPPYTPDAVSPVTFRMNRKPPPVPLIHRTYGLTFKAENPAEQALDLLLGGQDDMLLHAIMPKSRQAVAKPAEGTQPHDDVKVTAILKEDKTAYQVTITAIDADSGVIAMDKKNEYAPSKNYVAATNFDVEVLDKAKAIKKYAYIKARQGQYYCRLELSLNATKDSLTANIRSATNPDGSRNLASQQEMVQKQTNWDFKRQRRVKNKQQREAERADQANKRGPGSR